MHTSNLPLSARHGSRRRVARHTPPPIPPQKLASDSPFPRPHTGDRTPCANTSACLLTVIWLRCKSAELLVCDFPLLIPTHHWHLRRTLLEHARALLLPQRIDKLHRGTVGPFSDTARGDEERSSRRSLAYLGTNLAVLTRVCEGRELGKEGRRRGV